MIPADPTNVERAVSRTLRDSLERMQRTAKELDQAVADFVAACASNRPANALPSMMRAQTASASLAATLEVLSRFVTSALQSPNRAAIDPLELATVEVETREHIHAPEHAGPREENEAPGIALSAEPAMTAESVAGTPEISDWPTAAEPTEWSEAHESHDSPVRAEPFESEPEQSEIPPSETQYAEAQLSTVESESLAFEPPPDPALELTSEAPLSPEISAHPDALEPLAAFSAPEQRDEPQPTALAGEATTRDLIGNEETVPQEEVVSQEEVDTREDVVPQNEVVAHEEIPAVEAVSDGPFIDETPSFESVVADQVPSYDASADGIVDEPEFATEAAQATLSEESKIIEEAIAGGIAKMSAPHAVPQEVAQSEPASEVTTFDISLLPDDERELHRRASRVAKVSMQDIKLLQPQQVAIGRENKDICIRLHEEIERAHKEYGRRFKPIMSHPVDYFYDWMVEILAAGDPSALGEYPYQTPALRR
ncbi:MAG: hypothetical protein WA871_14625 [Candidatus Acidiferrales bacterium]